ncbi:DUF5671 domain-containing protein [Marivita sp. S6314]|uniref:DUF5671 domain-containing protein n=1 Tax=Marivita sp. S6314 TaxID=2926406 RepID=UPI001FF6748B|nr:DUF5671 domain-containing protein [Marivita sp. S6314]MCK0150798.1 DUF5671 domain-containing protein [Marivita sp. S6314]
MSPRTPRNSARRRARVCFHLDNRPRPRQDGDMSIDPDLSHFVRNALQRGLSQDDTRAALLKAGWADTEVNAALDGWLADDIAGPIPRPVRSNSARDAFFYALLFIVFGVVVGNALVLWFGQINIRFPDSTERIYSGQVAGLRWSIAALVVFLPVFWWLDRSDRRATGGDPARRFTGVRRWLSALALLCAVIALLTDALFLIYRWLDGQMTLRFALKSATVALMALIVLAYFKDNRSRFAALPSIPAGWILTALAIIAVGLTLMTIGGPAQGRLEQRDRARLSDLSTLSSNLSQCAALTAPLPSEFDPMDCANAPLRLTGFAADIVYARVTDTRFSLCIDVEDPATIYTSAMRIDGNTVCQERNIN